MAVTKTQFRRSIPSVLESLRSDVKPAGLKDRGKRRARVKESFWFFFGHYLPHYGEAAAPEFHREIIEMLEGGQRFTAIAAPRGFAKSTLVSFAYVIWQVLTEQSKFIVLVSATDDLAANLAEFIRLEFLENRRILEDYGPLLINTGEAGDFTAGKTRILARGRKQAVRGFRNRQHRPDLIILDDIEKDEEASSPKVVKGILNVILSGLVPSLDPKTGRLVMIGTLLRARSAAGTIIKSDEEPYTLWARKVYKALEVDTQGQEYSLWEERFPLGLLQELRENIGSGAFNREYQNMPADDDTALFKASWFIEARTAEMPSAYGRAGEAYRSYDPNSPIAVFIDPSVDGIKKSDYKAALFVSKTEAGFAIEKALLVQGSDREFFGKFWDAAAEYKPRIVAAACEANGFQVYFLRELMASGEARGITLPVSAIKNTLSKEMRIARLAAYFETGKLFFAPGTKSTKWGRLLMEQLEYFPTASIHDDGPDALEGALRLLENHTGGGSKFTFLPRRNLFNPRW